MCDCKCGNCYIFEYVDCLYGKCINRPNRMISKDAGGCALYEDYSISDIVMADSGEELQTDGVEVYFGDAESEEGGDYIEESSD